LEILYLIYIFIIFYIAKGGRTWHIIENAGAVRDHSFNKLTTENKEV
jgi:hypothetical protein